MNANDGFSGDRARGRRGTTLADPAKKVFRNERGDLCGESRPGAKLTQALVDAMRDLHEGSPPVSYARLVEWLKDFHGLEVSKQTVKLICTYQRWPAVMYQETRAQRERASNRPSQAKPKPKPKPAEDDIA